MSGRRQYKQPTRAQQAQIEEKKRIQQQAQGNTQNSSSSSGGVPGVQNVVTQLFVLVFERESKQLLRALSPQDFNTFVKQQDLKPSELDKSYFVLPFPLMDGMEKSLKEWLAEGKSGKQEQIESEPEVELEEEDPVVPMSPGVSVSVSESE